MLLYHVVNRTVVLTRQFRFPTFVNGNADGYLIEPCASLLDADHAETCIWREVAEETGYRIREPKKIFKAYMSPGSITKKLHFLLPNIATMTASAKVADKRKKAKITKCSNTV